MRKPLLSRGALVLFAACVVCLFTVTLSGHENDAHAGRISVLTDWTTHHVLYPLYGSPDRMMAAGRDPRSTFSWLRHDPNAPRWRDRRHHRESAGFDRDWSISLGPTAGTAANMYPAKFTFDITAAPSCANDYIVYPVNVAGSSTQPNLVAFNNLYSGTAGGNGICNRATPPADDDGTDATVLWSYNVSAIGGAVTTSPVLSWDSSTGAGSVLGTKVAFVESAPGQIAHFHVLAWKTGDGQDTTDADGLQNTLKPVQITTFVPGDPTDGSGTATDLTLGIDPLGSDTLSAPYVDYTHDYAYVGNDNGDLYRIKDVFCPTYNTDAGCTAGAGPSIDTSWGTAGVVVVGIHCGILTGAVDDSVTGNVYVGCSDGKLYGFKSTGVALSPTASLTLGDPTSSAFGGIVVPPIVDSSNGFVYAVTGSNNTSPVLMQASIALGSPRRNPLGVAPTPPAGENLSVPTFNTAYFSSPSSSSSTWAVLSCGFDSNGALTELYAVGFNSSRVMNVVTPPAANQFQLAPDIEACSPLTGFTNVVSGPPFPSIIDWLFLSLSGGNLSNYNLNGTTGGSGFGGGFGANANFSVSGGSSGIIPDNESTATQASSIYLSGLGAQTCGITGTGYCAVKLTQSGLN